MNKIAKVIGYMAGLRMDGLPTWREKAYLWTVIGKLILKAALLLSAALLFLFPYRIEKDGDTTDMRAFLYRARYRRYYDKRTRKYETDLRLSPFGIAADQIGSVKKLISKK